LMHGRVRNRQARLLHYFVSIEKQIQVDGSWPVALATNAAESSLNFQECVQEISGGQVGFQLGSGIEKVRLTRRTTDRSGVVIRRHLGHVDVRMFLEGLNRPAEIIAAVSLVAAQSNESSRLLAHDSRL